MSQGIGRKSFLELAAASLAGLALGPLVRTASAAATSLRLAAPQRAWDKVEFAYPGAEQNFPGIAVRLPQAAGGGLCAVGSMIGIRLSHPVFFCGCHQSTYDPLRIDNVIHGPASRRPWLFTVHEDATGMVVTGIEAGAGIIK